jgi:hypothetical protein
MKISFSRIFIVALLGCRVCVADPSSPSSAPAPAVNPPRGTSDAPAARGALPEDKANGPRKPAAQKPVVVQPAGPVFKDARNRAPAPAIVGGPAKNKTAGVINGTGMSHKPL